MSAGRGTSPTSPTTPWRRGRRAPCPRRTGRRSSWRDSMIRAPHRVDAAPAGDRLLRDQRLALGHASDNLRARAGSSSLTRARPLHQVPVTCRVDASRACSRTSPAPHDRRQVVHLLGGVGGDHPRALRQELPDRRAGVAHQLRAGVLECSGRSRSGSATRAQRARREHPQLAVGVHPAALEQSARPPGSGRAWRAGSRSSPGRRRCPRPVAVEVLVGPRPLAPAP